MALSLATAAIYVLVRRNYLAALLNMSPMAIHPAWPVSAIRGDCGDMKDFASTIWIGLALCMLVVASAIAVGRGRAGTAQARMGTSDDSIDNQV